MHVFLSEKYLKTPDLTSPCTEELLPYGKTKDPGLLLHPKHVLFFVSGCRYLYWFCCSLAPRISGQCHSGTDTEIDQVLCTDRALQAVMGLCLPQIQSIFHPEKHTTLFGVNSLVNATLAVPQQQSHRCLSSLWIFTVTATQEMTFWWLQRWPFLWLGWWMDLSVQTQPFCPAVDPFNKVFLGCWRLGALLATEPPRLSISSASHSSHTSLPSHTFLLMMFCF